MISCVILARDEYGIIGQCIDRLAWCDDVIVVLDPGSQDGTRALLMELPVRVFEHPFRNFAEQRNWAIENLPTRHDWLLMLDADELVTPDFVEELQRQVSNASSQMKAFAICRKTMFLGKWMKRSDSFPVWIMRIVRREVRFEDSGHGEVPIPLQRQLIGTIHAPLEHFAFYKGIENWIDKHNRYSSREATKESLGLNSVSMTSLFTTDGSKRRSALRDLARRTRWRPFLRFLYQYIFRMGFLEGREGLIYCSLLASYEAFILAKCQEIGHTTHVTKHASH